MFAFDPTQITFEIVKLKAVTTSIGGSILIVDEKKSTDIKEVLTRIKVPYGVARAFLMRTKKITRYLKPTYTALVRYQDRIVAMERHPLSSMGQLESEGAFGTVRWIPNCVTSYQHITKTIERSTHPWYFDGRYVYTLDSTIDDALKYGKFLTQSGEFRSIPVRAADLMEMHVAGVTDFSKPRECVAYITDKGDYAISPPIWKQLEVGAKHMTVSVVDPDEEGGEDYFQTKQIGNVRNFDQVDSELSINLNFALKAGQEIGRTFGYHFVEPLQLPRLMIELHTVNLPNVDKSVKSTYDTGMKFTHTVAWLLGLSRRANTLDTHVMIRSLLKYLTTRGIFKANLFNVDKIYLNMAKTEVSLYDTSQKGDINVSSSLQQLLTPDFITG